jgi:hypothetical protein
MYADIKIEPANADSVFIAASNGRVTNLNVNYSKDSIENGPFAEDKST